MKLCLLESGGKGAVCSQCGWTANVPLTAKRVCREESERNLEALSRICVECSEHFHVPNRENQGARCTHKNCGCLGKEVDVPTAILHGIAFSPQLINLLKRGRCPAGKW